MSGTIVPLGAVIALPQVRKNPSLLHQLLAPLEILIGWADGFWSDQLQERGVTYAYEVLHRPQILDEFSLPPETKSSIREAFRESGLPDPCDEHGVWISAEAVAFLDGEVGRQAEKDICELHERRMAFGPHEREWFV